MQMSGASRKSPGTRRSIPGPRSGTAAGLERSGGRPWVCPGNAALGADPAVPAAPPPPPPMLRNGGRDAPPPPPPYRLHGPAEPPSRGKPPPPPTRTPAGPPPPPPPVRNGHRDSISTVRAFLGEWDPARIPLRAEPCGCGQAPPEPLSLTCPFLPFLHR